MRREYEEYKPTGIEWIPQIPAHWNWSFLSQVASEQKIKKPKEKMFPVMSLSYGQIIRKKNIDVGIVPASYDNYQLISDGNIILRFTDLQNDHTSLRTGLVKEAGIITSAYTNIQPKINSVFLSYLLHSYDTMKIFYGLGGGVRQSIGFKDVRYLQLPVPPRNEQDQIVRFLDWKVSCINKLINIKKKEIKEIDELKRSMVSHVITLGLTEDAPMKYSGVKWLGDIPAHWTITKLRQILHPVSEKNHAEFPLLSVVREQGVILRDIEDKESNHNFIPDDLSGYKVVRKGQLAINKMKAWQGSYGVSDYIGIVSPAYFIFDITFENLEYFHYAIRSKVYVNFFAQASDGIRVGQWDLQMDKMKEIPFIIPPADEQSAIVQYLNQVLPKYDVAIETLTEEVAMLEEYKNKIVADTVTGKIDVRGIEIPEYEFVDEDVDADKESSEDESKENEDFIGVEE